jgi:hypothetical protein
MWLLLALLTKLTAYYTTNEPITIDRACDQISTAYPEAPVTARLVRHGQVIALIHDEQLAEALIVLLRSVPGVLRVHTETFVDLLRVHGIDEASGTCAECGQPAPCGTRQLLQDKIGLPVLSSGVSIPTP